MKKYALLLILLGVMSGLSPLDAKGSTQQNLKWAYKPAIVVSVKKLDTTVNHAHEVAFQLDCQLYIGLYKSANDYVPEGLTSQSRVNLRPEGHWLYVFIAPDQVIEMRRLSSTGLRNEGCSNGLPGASGDTIPAGTILPARLNSNIRSDKTRSGATISATIMQDVPLKDGVALPKGSTILGRVIEAVGPRGRSDEARVSFQFDQVRIGKRIFPVKTNLRALASMMEVFDATPAPTNASEDGSNLWNSTQMQIGGDQVSYGLNGPVMVGSQVVGTLTSEGVLAYVGHNLGSECRGVIDGNTSPQAFWVFSVNACGLYGFGDVKILHSGRTEPVGHVTLTSEGKTVKVHKSSGMLLRVDPGGTE